MDKLKRYQWVDALKFLAIFAIFLGHLGTKSGKLYLFVYSYHVPLFFFISGFFALKDMEKSLWEYTIKKFQQLIIPYICFSVISVVFYGLLRNMEIRQILGVIVDYMLGIRNTLISGGLWFLPCLFIVSILFFAIYKILKSRVLVMLGVVVIFVTSRTVLPTEPSWFMNIDSAMYYILYYALGNFFFKIIKNFNFKELKPIVKLIFLVGTSGALFLTTITYFKGIKLSVEIVHNSIKFLDWVPYIYMLHSVFVTSCAIYVNLFFAFMIKDIKIISKIGQNTLCLCGVENITKVLIETSITIVGLKLTLMNPMACIIYTFICVLSAHYIISPVIMRNIVKPATNLFLNTYNNSRRRINL